jgi:hypothetical protein
MENEIKKERLLDQLKNKKGGLLYQLIEEADNDIEPEYKELTEEEKKEEEKFLKKLKKLLY